MMKTNQKLNMRKVLATGAITLGGLGVMLTGVGMTQQVDATNSTENTTQTAMQDQKRGQRPELTDAQKTAMESAKKAAVASLSAEDQKTLADLEAKGHFSLTFAEREQLDAIQEKIMTYMSANPVEGLPTPPAKSGREKGSKMETTLTDEQKAELDTLKAEGISQLSTTEQARLKELDTKGRMSQTDAEKEELHALMEKVMTYVKSKVSFTMPEKPAKGQKEQQSQAQ